MHRVLPILFNTDMVRAILDGRKTVTRRVVKPPYYVDGDKTNPQSLIALRTAPKGSSVYNEIGRMPYPDTPWEINDVLYIRETYRVGAWDVRSQMIAFDYKDGTCGELVYIHDRGLFERLVNQSREDARKAKREYNGADFTWRKGESPCRWRPSIHMPKEAARIWLKVTDVRIERLQDTTEEQAEAEGIKRYSKDGILYKYAVSDDWWIDFHYKHKKAFTGNWWQDMPRTARKAFSYLWDFTIKKPDLDRYSWDVNPWVWVIEFERCEKPEECEE